MRRRELTAQIIVRCTPEEKQRWQALADRLDRSSGAWQRVSLSSVIRELLDEHLKTHPAPAAAGKRRAAARS